MNPDISCPVCGSKTLMPATHELSLAQGSIDLLVSDLEHYECATCGADPSFPDQVRRNERKIADAKRRSQRLLTSTEIREVREDLGLSQIEAAMLFGGGTNAFSKYERGEVIQSAPMDRLLRIIHAHPHLLGFLRAECSGVHLLGATSGATPTFYFTQTGGWKSPTGVPAVTTLLS